MSIPTRPSITRLQWVSSQDPSIIEAFTKRIGIRVQIYDIIFAKNKWYMWYVLPDDFSGEIKSGNLDR